MHIVHRVQLIAMLDKTVNYNTEHCKEQDYIPRMKNSQCLFNWNTVPSLEMGQ